MNTKELLPCPFCGNDRIDPKGWSNAKGDSGPQCFYVPDGLAASIGCGATAESIEAWNRRATPKPEASDELIAKGRELLALREKADAFELERNHMFGSGLVPTLEWEKSEAAASDNLAKAAHDMADWIASAVPMLEGKPAVSADDGRDAVLEEAAKACELEEVDAMLTGEPSDIAYNTAIMHCVQAIRALKSKPSAAGEKT